MIYMIKIQKNFAEKCKYIYGDVARRAKLLKNCCAGDIQGALYFTADNATNDDSIGDLPNLPVPISYPQYGGFALLPLEGPNYTARVDFHRPIALASDHFLT